MPSRRFAEQLAIIQQALNTPIATGAGGTGPDDPPAVFQRGKILVHDADAEWLQHDPASPLLDLGPRVEDADRNPERTARGGPTRLTIGPVTNDGLGDPMRRDDEVIEALRRLAETRERRDVRAAPNHVISIMNATSCPADEPYPTLDPRSVRGVTAAPAGNHTPLVLVIDTGLVDGWEQLGLGDGISPPGGSRTQETEIGPDGLPSDFIREYVGHGTFITGLLKAVAPTARVHVSNVLDRSGAALEDDFSDRLYAAVRQFETDFGRWPDIISLSAGTPVLHGQDGLQHFQGFVTDMLPQSTLLVAAAGNNGNSIRFWPAAYAAESWSADAVVSVGALREDLTGRACFSDHGAWVKVFAPGERLVSAFAAKPRLLQYQHTTFAQCQFLPPADNYLCTCRAPVHDGAQSHKPPLQLGEGDIADFTETSDARWSGTSFATPLVAGHIAQRMAMENIPSARDVYSAMREDTECIQIAGETALKVVPTGFSIRLLNVHRPRYLRP